MTNKEISNIFKDIYNVFWLKYRDLKLRRDSAEWEQINIDASALLEKYDQPLARHMILDLLDELERRCKDGE